MAGYALAAEDTSPGRVQRLFEVCAAPPWGCDVRSFSSFEPTLTFADFCPVTPHLTARRAVPMSNWGWGWGFARFKLAQPTQLSAWFVSGMARPSHYSVAALSPHAGQISSGRCANCRGTSAALTVGCIPMGFAAICHLPSAICHLPSPTASLGLDYAGCSPSPRTSCTPASSRPCLATSPLPPARGYPCSR